MVSRIGVRELKANLSRVLKRVQRGTEISVTDRGREIARLVPSAPPADRGWARAMVADGIANWNGGKPVGLVKPVRAKRGPSAADLIIEDRR